MNLVFKLNIGIAILTVIAYLAPFVSPEKFWLPGFAGYAIPFFMGLNFVFLMLWIIRSSMRLLVPLLTIMLGLGNIKASYSLSEEPPPVQHPFSVMTYNVNCFNPHPREGPKDRDAFEKITGGLIKENAEVLCLQEYCSYPTIKRFDTKSKLLASGYKHLFYQTRSEDEKFETAGLAIFTRLPSAQSGAVKMPTREVIAIYMDLVVFTDTIRVYNTHLHSMGLINDQEVEQGGPVKKFISSMITGFQAKAAEAAVLKDHLLQSPHPVILAGDFNETPYSYVYRSFKKHFNNSFEIAGRGFGVTYNGKIPFLRIDHQFADKKFRILHHRVVKDMNISDHFPVMVDYTLE